MSFGTLRCSSVTKAMKILDFLSQAEYSVFYFVFFICLLIVKVNLSFMFLCLQKNKYLFKCFIKLSGLPISFSKTTSGLLIVNTLCKDIFHLAHFVHSVDLEQH